MGNRALPGGPPLQDPPPLPKNTVRGPNNYRCLGAHAEWSQSAPVHTHCNISLRGGSRRGSLGGTHTGGGGGGTHTGRGGGHSDFGSIC